ncbi:hypothetical protein [Pueribacillus sp. YX66]|uniref:hypothetical protein n=1 Tax=Pueribacillus sp. YX66 TaxID=3229242 RepID=UPI00358D71F5
MKRAIISIFLLTFLLGACSSKDGVVTMEQYESLEEGMLKTDVEELLGKPLEIDDNKWIYDLKKDDKIISLTIFFLDDEISGAVTGSKKEES